MFSEIFPPRCRQPQYWAGMNRTGMTIGFTKPKLNILNDQFTFRTYFHVISCDFYNFFNNYYFLRPNVFWAGGRWWVMIDAWSWQEAWFCTAPVPSHDISHKTRLWLKTSCLKRSFICQRTKSVSCHVCKDICWKNSESDPFSEVGHKIMLFIAKSFKVRRVSRHLSPNFVPVSLFLQSSPCWTCCGGWRASWSSPTSRSTRASSGCTTPSPSWPASPSASWWPRGSTWATP